MRTIVIDAAPQSCALPFKDALTLETCWRSSGKARHSGASRRVVAQPAASSVHIWRASRSTGGDFSIHFLTECALRRTPLRLCFILSVGGARREIVAVRTCHLKFGRPLAELQLPSGSTSFSAHDAGSWSMRDCARQAFMQCARDSGTHQAEHSAKMRDPEKDTDRAPVRPRVHRGHDRCAHEIRNTLCHVAFSNASSSSAT